MSSAASISDDDSNWLHYLEKGEALLGVWRPDDTFRLYGLGKVLMYGCWAIAGLFIVGPMIMINDSGNPAILPIGLAIAAFGTALGYGPAWLDQRGRQKRRYALSDQRVLEFQDIDQGRLRFVPIGPNLRAAKLYNDKLETYEVAFAELDEEGRAGRSVLFERLTEDQADQVLTFVQQKPGASDVSEPGPNDDCGPEHNRDMP